jgi:PiT family inorganic phosphate transporter
MAAAASATALQSKISRKPGVIGIAVFGIALVIGFIYAAAHLVSDLSTVHPASIYPFVLLGVALLIALGFEFVNGFHDTANAVATVIYTHSLEPHVAVVWSGMWNFLGVLTSTGAVAFGIITLLPVELILQVGSGSGFAMVFALLAAAILWNLGTWYFGLPSSSSHTMVGSIIGVGIANQLMSVRNGTSGVDWSQATNVGKTLLISPLVGFFLAAILLLISKIVLRNPKLYAAPEGNQPPPWWIRLLLIGTCTGVSFAHGSNDGQKGMGLIMLILIGTVPTAYALNHAITGRQTADFVAVSHETVGTIQKYVDRSATIGDPHDEIRKYVSTREFTPPTMLALQQLVTDLGNEAQLYKELKNVPERLTPNFRNDMYLASEALRLMKKSGTPKLDESDWVVLDNYKKHIDAATKFIPTLGQSGGGDGTGSGHHGGLEAHRRYSWREDRQGASDLCPRRRRRNYGYGHDLVGRSHGIAGQHHARTFVGRRWNDGCKPFRPAVEHCAFAGDGLGADAALVDYFGCVAVLAIPADDVRRGAGTPACRVETHRPASPPPASAPMSRGAADTSVCTTSPPLLQLADRLLFPRDNFRR